MAPTPRKKNTPPDTPLVYRPTTTSAAERIDERLYATEVDCFRLLIDDGCRRGISRYAFRFAEPLRLAEIR